jgi:hypothetical protein
MTLKQIYLKKLSQFSLSSLRRLPSTNDKPHYCSSPPACTHPICKIFRRHITGSSSDEQNRTAAGGAAFNSTVQDRQLLSWSRNAVLFWKPKVKSRTKQIRHWTVVYRISSIRPIGKCGEGRGRRIDEQLCDAERDHLPSCA